MLYESMRESWGVLVSQLHPISCADQGYAIAAQRADDEEASSLFVCRRELGGEVVSSQKGT